MRFVLPIALLAGAFSNHPAMTDPSKATEKAPDVFKAKFETTKGDVVMECTREWAPNGVDRFYNLVKIGFFDDVAFFRVVKGFVVQWGIHGDPKVSSAWQRANIPRDPVKQKNSRGMVTYAMGRSPDTRSTQIFINFGDNQNLDSMGFAPICKVVEGMDEVVDKFYNGYGEDITDEQGTIASQGNEYLKSKWPKLDYIKTATIIGEQMSPERKSAAAPAGQSENNNTHYYVIGGLGAAVVVGYFATRKKEEPPPPEPKKKKKKKKTSD